MRLRKYLKTVSVKISKVTGYMGLLIVKVMCHILDLTMNSEFLFQMIYNTNFNSKGSKSDSYLVIYAIY